ncbi:MAG: CapA family protein, partial [Actinomycetota bacterium]|nr:CapA family protein [Actinomycetota bacterium]
MRRLRWIALAVAAAVVASPLPLRLPARAADAASHVLAFGQAPKFSGPLPDTAVAAAATTTGRGLIVAGSDGAVTVVGDAVEAGRVFGRLNEPIVGMASSPSGRGYWLVARDGGVFSFGDAVFHGSGSGSLPAGTGAIALVPVGGAGYWIVAGGSAIRVMAAGDVHGERQIGDQLGRGENPLAEVASVLSSADVAAVNLETPAGDRGVPQSKEFVFLAPPQLLGALRS